MIQKIENIICIGEGLTPEEIHCKSRNGELKEARQIIMYFAKEMMPSSTTWKMIAGYFGLDHATAMHAHQHITDLMDSDKSFRDKIKRHEMRLKAIKIDKLVTIAVDKFKPLEFEVMKLEKEINNLVELIMRIREEIKILNCYEINN